jgi:leader peptidase (prepilin peptidase) / N-methyltransferase
MPLLLTGCVLIGLVVARSIVAEADAHRRSGGDAWWGPRCGICDGPLGPTMQRCSPLRHPQRGINVIVLVVTPIVMAAMAVAVPTTWVLPAYLSFGAFTILLTITDLDTQLLPNRILLPATVVGGVLLALGAIPDGDGAALVRAVAAGAAYFAVMLVLALVARGALGMGDVKFAFYLGMFTGYLGWWYVVIAGLGGFLVGGVASILLLVMRRVTRKDSVPFGPFMACGAVIAVVAGTVIIDWYVG